MIQLLAAAAIAASCPPDLTIDAIMAKIAEGGGYVIEWVEVPARGFDHVLIFTMGGKVVLGGFAQGCVVTDPVMLADAAETTGA